jgi:hypothetical protein
VSGHWKRLIGTTNIIHKGQAPLTGTCGMGLKWRKQIKQTNDPTKEHISNYDKTTSLHKKSVSVKDRKSNI